MSEFLQQILNGLFLGGIYALFAVGLTLSLGVLRVLNNAHGITLAIAAIAGVKVTTEVSLPFPVVLLVGAAAGAAIGVLLEIVAFRPLRAGPSERDIELPSLVSSLAMLFILQTVALQWTGAEVQSFPRDVYTGGLIEIGSFSIRSILLVTFVIAVALVVACWWAVERTQFGRAVRALAMDGEAASMFGINVNRLKLITMAASSGMAGVAGILIGVALGSVNYNLGESQLLKGFTVVILGGIGSIPGALAGGLTLGVVEGATVDVLGSSWSAAAGFVLLIGFLVVRPQGFFGRPVVDRA